jgi:two-component system chemotaxis sensor kinase CheA
MANAGKIDTKKGDAEDQALHLGGAGKQVNLDAQEFLLFNLGTAVVHAIPLCLVLRLEEFLPKDIEYSGEQRVVRYRNSLLPILNLADLLGYNKGGEKKNLEKSAVVVIQRSGRSFGIEVSEILDVVTIEEQIDDTIRDRPGILGNIVFNNSVIAVVDALGVIEQTAPSLKQSGGLEDIRSLNKDMKSKKIRILFAEDVAFFRRHVSKVLTDAGFAVTTVEDGAKALEALESAPNGEFNLVLSDIEMPKMTGLDLAREIRRRDQFKAIPMIALTTRFKDKDVQEGKQAGFDLYLEKLNPEKLLSSIDAVMKTSGR